MKLLIKQKMFSLAGAFHVFDEQEQVRYTVKGKLLSWVPQLQVFSAGEEEPFGVLRQKAISWLPKYFIEFHGERVGSISRRFTWGRPVYDVDLKDWRVEGDLFEYHYTVYHGETPVLQIEKKFWAMTDTYILDVLNPADERLALMIVLAIDLTTRNRD